MAQSQPCSSEDGNAAVMLVSNLTNGETEGWCSDCMPLFAMSILGITPAMMAAALESMPDAPTDEADNTNPAGSDGVNGEDSSKSDDDETEATSEPVEESPAASE